MRHILIIGVGSIGERHLRCFLATGRVTASIVETNPELRATIAARYSVKSAYASLEEALSDARLAVERPEAAVVCTPAQLHIPMAQLLADRGIHLLIEKPLSTSFDGIERLATTIAERNLVAGVAYVLRMHPVLASMRESIQSGRFGSPVELVAVCGQHFPTYRPAYRQIYYTNRATGGGAIQDALTHVVNAGQWLVGPIDRVIADAAHQVLEGVEVEDTVHLLARHGRLLANYSLNQHQAPNETTITVICERGAARAELHAMRWRWMTKPGGEWTAEHFEPIERDSLFIAQAQMLLDALDGRRPVSCTLDEALATLRVNLGALRSLDTQSFVAVNVTQ